jgi:predicted transcriptional regulator
MSYLKTSTIMIRLDDVLERKLGRACARTGRTRSDLARDALRRQLALLRFKLCAAACCRSPNRRAT